MIIASLGGRVKHNSDVYKRQPVGMRVWAKATLSAQEGRSYDFTIEAFDEAGLIGRATHKRVAVKSARFLEKAEAKKQG